MVSRHHTVLAQVSLSYSVPKGRFPRVTHPCATNLPTEVGGSFDLHVLGMPPAFVLSQDQTLKFMSQSLPGGNLTTTEFRSLSVCTTYLAVSPEGLTCFNAFVIKTYKRRFNHATWTLKCPGRGPPPTCPFIQPTMRKSGNKLPPDYSGDTLLPFSELVASLLERLAAFDGIGL